MIKERLNGYRYTQAIVGFGGKPTLWWMRFLKKGFYHCVVALGYKDDWVVVDPLLNFTDVIHLQTNRVESFFERRGYKVIKVKIEEPKKILLRVMPYTCVENAKRLIGVENPYIITPYGLFCYLNKKIGKKSLTRTLFYAILFFSW